MSRRIGERHPVTPVEVVWTTRHYGPRGPLRRTTTYTRRSVGHLRDLSISGARIEGPRFLHLRKDVPVVITVAGMDAQVEMRRWETTDRPEVICYGVEFIDLDERFRDRLYEFVGDGRPYVG